MNIRQIGDWTLEDRLAAGGPPVVVMFREAEGRKDFPLRLEFRRVAEDHPDASFYEVDLLENPSAAAKYSLGQPPLVVVFVDGEIVVRHAGRRIGEAVLRALGPCRQEGEDA